MENEKKVYEEPTVTMMEFDFSERIAASGCNYAPLDPETSCDSSNFSG